MPGYVVKKRQLEILIGNNDELLTELLSEWIIDIFKDNHDLRFRSASYGEDLLELSKSRAVDIFILILNNIMFRSPLHPPQERLECALQLITQIKKTYGKPVIALSGWMKDSSFVARAKLSADFFFPLPVGKDDFGEAVKKCLTILPLLTYQLY
jgi:hypothetical protein